MAKKRIKRKRKKSKKKIQANSAHVSLCALVTCPEKTGHIVKQEV